MRIMDFQGFVAARRPSFLNDDETGEDLVMKGMLHNPIFSSNNPPTPVLRFS